MPGAIGPVRSARSPILPWAAQTAAAETPSSHPSRLLVFVPVPPRFAATVPQAFFFAPVRVARVLVARPLLPFGASARSLLLKLPAPACLSPEIASTAQRTQEPAVRRRELRRLCTRATFSVDAAFETPLAVCS